MLFDRIRPLLFVHALPFQMIYCIRAVVTGLLDETPSAPNIAIRWLLGWHCRFGLQLLFHRKRHIVEQCGTGIGVRLTLAGGYRVLRRWISITFGAEKFWEQFIEVIA